MTNDDLARWKAEASEVLTQWELAYDALPDDWRTPDRLGQSKATIVREFIEAHR